MFHKACVAPFAALALIAAAPAPSAGLAGGQDREAGSATSSSQAADSAKAERKTCKNLPDTVSRMRTRRLCLTREQWREFEDAQQ